MDVPQRINVLASNPLAPCLALCGVGHFAVDFACALTVVSFPYLCGLEDSSCYQLVILYNLVAFGSQFFWGLSIDRLGAHREGMTAGLLFASIGAAIAVVQPFVAVLLLACGNALFHVGAGAIVYNAAPGRASGPGLFVAPGGIGLLAGVMLGSKGALSPLCAAPILCIIAYLNHRMIPIARRDEVIDSAKGEDQGFLPLVLLLLLLVVALRSFIGFALPIPWKGVQSSVVLLALASFTGKASGGYLADRFGWRPLCLAMLVVATVAGVGHHSSILAACIALFCIQATTGVTLAGVQALFPGRPAFAFGLPCIALLVGAWPFFLPKSIGFIHTSLTALASVAAALAIGISLTLQIKGRTFTCRGERFSI